MLFISMKSNQSVPSTVLTVLLIIFVSASGLALAWNWGRQSASTVVQNIPEDANAQRPTRLTRKPTITSQKPTDTTFSKAVAVGASFYPDVRASLRAGDLVTMPAVRDSATSPITTSNAKFQNALDKLNAATLNGLKKSIVFSAIDDAKNLVSVLPSDVTIVGYDFEGGMTPSNELQDPVGSVTQFAAIVHAAGKKVSFGPTVAVWMRLENTGRVALVAKAVDTVVLQGQKVLAQGGMAALTNQVNTLGTAARKANPGVSYSVQLWVGLDTTADIISGFKNIQNSIDTAIIGTQNQLSGVQDVLKGLGR